MEKNFFTSAKRDDSIHLVGISGTEMSALCFFLLSRGFKKLTLHDFSKDFDASFYRNHRFYPSGKQREYRNAVANGGDIISGEKYLKGIDNADHIFVPQSWFLYKENKGLYLLQNRFRFFHNICFEVFPGYVICVTGTCGKSSTVTYIAGLTNGIISGNDRENVLDLAVLEEASGNGILVFELSNRHLKNGISGRIDLGVLTNICPNHIPDHGSLEGYLKIKNSIFRHARSTVYNRRNPCKELAISPSGENCFSFSSSVAADACIRGNNVTILDEDICTIDDLPVAFSHQRENMVAALIAAKLAGIKSRVLRERLPLLKTGPSFRSRKYCVGKREFINDGAACVPENTATLVSSMTQPVSLVVGGSRQHPLDNEFCRMADAVVENKSIAKAYVYGSMKKRIADAFAEKGFSSFHLFPSMREAVIAALKESERMVVFTPGCGVDGEFSDKYERGEVFDHIVKEFLQNKQKGL